MQKTVALSLCEAELIADGVRVQDMLYAKNLLESIGLKVKLPIITNPCIDWDKLEIATFKFWE